MLTAAHVSYRVPARTLVDRVDLTVAAGECVALLGPNGAGKSTLLKLLCGQIRPAEGEIRFDGKALPDWPPFELARRRAVLPQSSAVPFDFTSTEIVLLGRSPHGDASSCHDMALAAMTQTECAHLAERTVTTLSGGELQRVQLARVLVQLGGESAGPRCLMLDEPISNLDPSHQHGALRVARDLAAQGMAVLIVLHDLNLAAQYTDRLVLMKDGRIVADGKPESVLTEERIAEVFNVRARIVPNPLCPAPAVFLEPL